MDIAESYILIFLTFLLAGAVKGVIGMGLPTVSLAILAAALDLISAMSLLLMPSLVTNLWQAFTGGRFLLLLNRLKYFFAFAGLTVLLGSQAFTVIGLAWLSALLGLLLIIYALSSLLGIGLSIDPSRERWLGPVMGISNGVLTGMTGSFVVPGVMYLQAIGLGRDALVQAMGILFSISTLALFAALYGHGLLTFEVGITSTIAVGPALAGMVIGQKIRRAIPQPKFRLVFFNAVLVIGVYIVLNNLPGAINV